MRFDILTIFPEFFAGPLDYGIVRRAREAGLAEVCVHDLRNWTHDRHRTVDDRPFGGGEGMVLKPEPIFEAVESLLGWATERAEGTEREGKNRTAIVLLSAAGKLFRQETARRLAALEHVVLICGRYEGVDERVAEHLATDEISVGDFVLSGGELPAAMILDAVTRLLPGALGNEASAVQESFSAELSAVSDQHSALSSQQSGVSHQHSASGAGAEGAAITPASGSNFDFRVSNFGILDCPHYTRPAEFRGWTVPETLLSGNHAEIRRWRRKTALAKTLRNRPDLLAGALLGDEDRAILEELQRR
jgi:tRNA (guanine37-N1)-methyltransferase